MLFAGETDFPIYGAAMADTGHFALITGSDTHLSQVLLYDANFKLIQRFARDSATTSVTLSHNGTYVALGGMITENGSTKGLVELYRIGVKNSAFRVTPDQAVLALDFTDNRHLAVLCAGGFCVMDLDGEYEDAMHFDTTALCAYDVNENGCALVLTTDPLRRESRVVICDKKGNILYDDLQSGDVSDVALLEENVFFLCGTQAVRFAWASGARDEIACSDGAEGIFAVNKDALRVIYAGEARLLDFD